MKVSLVNTMMSGGAAVAALRLHEGLRRLGVESRFLTKSSSDISKGIFSVPPPTPPSSWFRISKRILRGLPLQLKNFRPAQSVILPTPTCEVFTDCRVPEGNGLNDKLAGSELINLHWVSWLVDLPGLVSSVGGKTPIVWTLHDMNPMTGGCHYDGGCGLYARACGSCPQLRNPGAKDASHEIFAIRKKAIDRLSEKDLHVVVLCKWMADKVRQSPILGRFPCTVMPNGIDTDVFFPIPRPSARESLGISHEKETLLFVAETVTNHRKGFDLLQKAVITLADRGRQIQLLSVGRGDVSGLTSAGIDLVNIGLVTNEHFMRVLYSAADLFVIPSREDNLPNTVMESIACGTPVVGFNIGGIPEMVRPGETGWLAEKTNSDSLLSTIIAALDEVDDVETARYYRQRCRDIALNEYSLLIQGTRYRNLFASTISQFAQ